MVTKRKNEALRKYRAAADLVKERCLDLRAAEAACKREKRRLNALMRELFPVVRLSDAQKARVRRASDAQSAAFAKKGVAVDAWLKAIDRLLAVGKTR